MVLISCHLFESFPIFEIQRQEGQKGLLVAETTDLQNGKFIDSKTFSNHSIKFSNHLWLIMDQYFENLAFERPKGQPKVKQDWIPIQSHPAGKTYVRNPKEHQGTPRNPKEA